MPFSKSKLTISYSGAGGINSKLVVRGQFVTVYPKYSKFVSLKNLSIGQTYKATGLFDNYGVSEHPSDSGMKAIAELIWNSLR